MNFDFFIDFQLIDLLVAIGGESHARCDHPTRVVPFP